MMTIIIIAIVLALVLWFLFNPTANRIRKINEILNKDRSVCDFINSLPGWFISPMQNDGVSVVITPEYMPTYVLYITYNSRRPTNKQIEKLFLMITNVNSPVSIAHSNNIPYDYYIANKNKY